MSDTTLGQQPPAFPLQDGQAWTVDDPRMWREQCRIGDVAFQHLFCTSKDKPVPDWVRDGLPRMYHLLDSHSAMMDELALAIQQYNELLMAVARVFPGETRHETALRYIREAEEDCMGHTEFHDCGSVVGSLVR